MFDWIFVAVTAAVALHGITYRTKLGESSSGHLLFGCIALLFCMRVLLVDILNLF